MQPPASSGAPASDDLPPEQARTSLKALREYRRRDSLSIMSASRLPASTSPQENHMGISSLSFIPELETGDQVSNSLSFIPELEVAGRGDGLGSSQKTKQIPMVGALLIDSGLITREQLNASLLIQKQDHPDTPIGQILVRCGYISQQALDQALENQLVLQAALADANEAQALPKSDLTALLLHRRGSELAYSVLNQLGVMATPVRNWKELYSSLSETRFDLILLDSEMLDETSVLPDQGSIPLLLLPPFERSRANSFQLPQWVRTLLARFVGQVRAQRQQRDLAERLNEREYELSVVAAMSRSITTSTTSRDALPRLMMTVRDLFGVEAGTLYRFDRAVGELVFEVVLGPHQEKLYQQRLPIDRGLAGWVVRNGEPLLIPDARRDPRFEGQFDNKSGFQTRSVLCVPLIVQGEVRGVVQLLNKLNGAFNERDLMLLRILVAMGGLAEAADASFREENTYG